MSKPKGKCAFCPRTNLSKSHIWPEWAQKVLPSIATHYEIARGGTRTYVPRALGTEKTTIIKPGAAAARRPRNTCVQCNSGWMREIEEAAQASVSALMLGRPELLTVIDQQILATFLCLVSMRISLTVRDSHPIPMSDFEHLIKYREPPPDWKIWIASFEGDQADDYWFGYFPMAMMSVRDRAELKALTIGPEHCNTQVTTLVVGKFCAHLFSSMAGYNFDHYEGIQLATIWSPRQLYIDTGILPVIDADTIPELHEAIARDRDAPEAFV
jgi:hypothetical protein